MTGLSTLEHGDAASPANRAFWPFASASVPFLLGYLRERGFGDCVHLDLNVTFADWWRRNPDGLATQVFADDVAVDRYLRTGDGPPIRAAVGRILDIAKLGATDLFGLSLGTQSENSSEMALLTNVNLGIVRGVKDRFPGCRTVIGGYRSIATREIRPRLLSMLARCPSLDVVVQGAGERILASLAEWAAGLAPLEESGHPHERHGSQFYLFPSGQGLPEGLIADPRRVEPVEVHDHLRLSDLDQVTTSVPWYPNAEDYRVSGRYLADSYRLSEETRTRVGAAIDRSVLPLLYGFTTGCSGTCSFCRMALVPTRGLPVADAVRAIATLTARHDTNHLILMNNCLNWSYEYASAFLDALLDARLDLRWTDSLTLAHLDERLVDKLRRSGFVRADIGVESGSRRMRRRVRKPLSNAEIIARLRLLHEHGIWNDINLIVGLPHETDADVAETIDFVEEAGEVFDNCAVATFNLFDVSPVGEHPERHGISIGARPVLVGGPRGSWKLPFDETDGRTFEVREAAAWDAHERLWQRVIRRNRMVQWNGIPYALIFWLYDAFGHDGKAAIREIYAEAARSQAGKNAGPRPALFEGKTEAGARMRDDLGVLEPGLRWLAGQLGRTKDRPLPGVDRLAALAAEGPGVLRVTLDLADGQANVGVAPAGSARSALVAGERFCFFYSPGTASHPTEARLAEVTHALARHVAGLGAPPSEAGGGPATLRAPSVDLDPGPG